ncbi:MAG: non-homologous end-joining DNA ligase [Cytophagaceae bacterium]|nr:non-homologous end-joining DNA ligase [Cytophagaceae bacterium]
MGLKEYKAKRKFADTPEPSGKIKEDKKGEHRFVVQKHHASHLHYDFRLEIEGVLKSWAVPKGPSMNPADKRLAMMVEDHPFEYGKFEGIIPPGNYGAGTVMVWDEGTYHVPGLEGRELNEKELKKALREGNLKFVLEGKKLKGEFALVHMKRGKGNEWLLFKKADKYSKEEDITKKDKSVITNRTLEQIKKQSGTGNTVWRSGGTQEIELPAKAEKSKLFHDIKPMMCMLVDEVFDSDEWIYEIKWDGYRAIAEVNYNDVLLYSRNLLPFNEMFPDVVNALSEFGQQVILDGEVVVTDENGRSEFQRIQNYRRNGGGKLMYYVFDILYYNGYDLRDVPLVERKELLKKIIPESDVIKYSDHIKGQGIKFMELAREKNLEGIIAKKANSVYEAGVRGKNWLKIKIHAEQEAVICGFTEPRGGRKNFGALILGVYEGDELVYIGHTGTGFNHKSLTEMHRKLNGLVTDKSPFHKRIKTNMPVTWVKPKLVCVVKFQEWTGEGLMRVPVFQGLRIDKDPKEVKKENSKTLNKVIQHETSKRSIKAKVKVETEPGEVKTKDKKTGRSGKGKSSGVKNRAPVKKAEGVKAKAKSQKQKTKKENSGFLDQDQNELQVEIEGHGLKFTNLKKIYWPQEGYTKRDLIEYYDKISPYILPYLKDRPENLRRNPNGITQGSFFQKDMPDTIPDWIKTKKLYSESNDKNINYMICQSKADLLYMANLGCIEINPWLSRIQSIEYPDYFVIDLDPQDVPSENVIEVAHAVKEVLDRGNITGFCKTSGSRGLHIYVPLGAKYDYDQTKQFAELIASLTNELVPKITSLERMPARRKNKIYLDYLQNRRGQTLAAPYCVRPKPGATVSTPLEWEEVKDGLHPSQFNIRNIFERLKEKGDIFKGIMGKGADIEKALKKLKR